MPIAFLCPGQASQRVGMGYDLYNNTDLGKKYFDIILFSYNGLDCIDIKHRKNVLEGITKLLKDRGKFIFSMHYLIKALFPNWIPFFELISIPYVT